MHTLIVCVFSFVWAETVNTSLQVDKLNSSLAQLQSSMDRIQANVTAVKNQINQTSSKPNCNSYNVLQAELQKLPVDTSITVSTDSA